MLDVPGMDNIELAILQIASYLLTHTDESLDLSVSSGTAESILSSPSGR